MLILFVFLEVFYLVKVWFSYWLNWFFGRVLLIIFIFWLFLKSIIVGMLWIWYFVVRFCWFFVLIFIKCILFLCFVVILENIGVNLMYGLYYGV